MSILIKNAELNHSKKDLLILGNRISEIDDKIENAADIIIDGTGKAIVPGMFNGHTHAAMTLMRGYADDMPLMPWLEEKIWPLENKLTEEDVYWGAKLACLEMIKTGTITMVDMYHKFPSTVKAVDEMGLRCMLTHAHFDFGQPALLGNYKKLVEKQLNQMASFSNRIQYAMGPHAIYTVSADSLKWIAEFARHNGLRIHTHLSETSGEVEDALKNFGMLPVEYLYSLGVLGPNLSLAHCLYLNDDEIKMLADNGCQVVHNPASNLKLASGNRFRSTDLKNAGVTICLGTDGTCSGNNLDMYETMKLAALTSKVAWNDPTIWSAEETFAIATETVETVTGIKSGKIETGYLADLCLVNLNVPEMTPNFNLISNLVYSANGNVVNTVICDGKVLMENRKVPGEEEIMEKAQQAAFNLIKR